MKNLELAGLFTCMVAAACPGPCHAESYLRGPDGYYYPGPEAVTAKEEWMGRLAPFEFAGCTPPVAKTDLLRYVGYPRDQGSMGLCWLFANVGLLEVQHAINCAMCEDWGSESLPGGCPSSTDLGYCPSPGEMEFPIHLSPQTFIECGGKLISFLGDAPPMLQQLVSFVDYTSMFGLPPETVQPYEFADTTSYDDSDDYFRGVCPMMDRDGSGRCDLQEIAFGLGEKLFFIRTTGADDFRSTSMERTEDWRENPAVCALANNHVLVATFGRWCVRNVDADIDPPATNIECASDEVGSAPCGMAHDVLLIGYEFDEAENELYWYIRNSHDESGPLRISDTDARECRMAGQATGMVGYRTYGIEEVDAGFPGNDCPSSWTTGEWSDLDDDGIPNILDRCLYEGNGYSNDASLDTEVPSGDFWPGPGGTGEGEAGCDSCPTIYNPYQTDADYDGFGDACDNCVWAWSEDQDDYDGDGIGDSCDNCTLTPNEDQLDCHQFSPERPSGYNGGKPIYECFYEVCSDGDACDGIPCPAPVGLVKARIDDIDGVPLPGGPSVEPGPGSMGFDDDAFRGRGELAREDACTDQACCGDVDWISDIDVAVLFRAWLASYAAP